MIKLLAVRLVGQNGAG